MTSPVPSYFTSMTCANCNDWRALVLAQLSYPSTCNSCDFCQELSIIEDQVRDSVAALQSLLQRHKRKKKQINHVHSPIMKLPPELLSTVFLLLRPGDVLGHNPSVEDRADAFQPLLLGAVCTTWRQLAWATPQLWNRPFFDCSIIQKQDRHPLALEWLSRAQLVPVTLSITYVELYSIHPGARPFLEAIASTSSQWKTVSAEMTFTLMQYMFHCVRRWDNIDNLLLYPNEGPYYLPEDQPLFGEAKPSPRSITIPLYAVTFDKMNINWCRVQEAKVEPLSEEACIRFLHAHPALESCEFTIIDDSSNSIGTPISALTHYRLRSLTFDEFSGTSSHLLARLTLPNLDHLSLNKNESFEEDIENEVLTFFLQSRPSKLQKLELVGFNFNLEDMKLLLELLPAVLHLHLPISWSLIEHDIGSEPEYPLLRHLAATMDEPGLIAPRLEVIELSLNKYLCIDIQWNTVAEIVASLYYPVIQVLPHRRPLKTFRFNLEYLHYEPTPSIAKRKIYELTQAGAEIMVNDDLVVVSAIDLEEEEQR